LSESNTRSVAKAVSYRLFGSLTTFAIAFALTGDPMISSAVGIADLVAKAILFYVHERLWNRISWGRQK
jgi:uncharacterized membrane protein